MTRPGFAPFNVKTGRLKPTQFKPSAALHNASLAAAGFLGQFFFVLRGLPKGQMQRMGKAPSHDKPGLAPFNVKTAPLKPTQDKPLASLAEVYRLNGTRQALLLLAFSGTSFSFFGACQRGMCKWMGQAPSNDKPELAPLSVKTGPLKPIQVKPLASLSEVQGLTGARQAWPTFSETFSSFFRAFQKGKCKWMGQAPSNDKLGLAPFNTGPLKPTQIKPSASLSEVHRLNCTRQALLLLTFLGTCFSFFGACQKRHMQKDWKKSQPWQARICTFQCQDRTSETNAT